MCEKCGQQYASLSDAVGPYSYTNEDNSMAPPQLCLYNYKEGIIFGFNESYVFNNDIIEGMFKYQH
ncbi:Mucolipin-2 [Homalodisca vitripennis]|nr:Mucolipin-2 [Homalodisca vitripennis]